MAGVQQVLAGVCEMMGKGCKTLACPARQTPLLPAGSVLPLGLSGDNTVLSSA